MSLLRLACLLLLVSCPPTLAAPKVSQPWEVPAGLATHLDKLGAAQCLWVVPENPASPAATVVPLAKRSGGWAVALSPFPAVIGRKGLAPEGEKREGDERSPSGVFPLGFAFGYAPSLDIMWRYRPSRTDDVWVDDPDAPDYNTLTRKGDTKAKSFEYLKRSDDLYKLGIVVEYNIDPVVPGHGSAIFMHLWKDSQTGTAGCVAFAENQMNAVLAWLDPGRRACVAILARE